MDDDTTGALIATAALVKAAVAYQDAAFKSRQSTAKCKDLSIAYEAALLADNETHKAYFIAQAALLAAADQLA